MRLSEQFNGFLRALLALGLLYIAAPSLPARSNPDVAEEPVILSVTKRERDFEYELRLPGNDRISMSCREFIWQKMVVSSANKGALGDFIRCSSGRESQRKLVIWIHGGPWAYAGTDLVLEQIAFLEAGYDLFVPLYPGSSDRPTVFEGAKMVPDVVDALDELQAVLNWSRTYYGLVDVAGESFGAFLAVTLMPRLTDKESLVLINPSLGGPRFLPRHYVREGGKLEINGVSNDATQAEAKRITEAYFRRLVNYDPAWLLQASPTANLKLIYGGSDDLMIKAEIALLRKLAVPRCGLEFRPDSGHEFGYTRGHLHAARKLIQCRRQPATTKR